MKVLKSKAKTTQKKVSAIKPTVEPVSVKATALSNSNKSSKSKNVKSIEEIYQKKTQLEHILLRPDTYIGSTESITEKMWVYDSDSDTMQFR